MSSFQLRRLCGHSLSSLFWPLGLFLTLANDHFNLQRIWGRFHYSPWAFRQDWKLRVTKWNVLKCSSWQSFVFLHCDFWEHLHVSELVQFSNEMSLVSYTLYYLILRAFTECEKVFTPPPSNHCKPLRYNTKIPSTMVGWMWEKLGKWDGSINLDQLSR